MAMNPNTLRNLTLASAQHLVTQGHITKGHHSKILKSLKKPGSVPMAPKAPVNPGSLAPPPPQMKMGAPKGPVGMAPQQLEAPMMGALDAQGPVRAPWEA